MITFLPEISGPEFLLLYWLGLALFFGGYKLLTKASAARQQQLPEPTSFSPLELATFTNGETRVLHTVLYELIEKKQLLLISSSGRHYQVQQNPEIPRPDRFDSSLEKVVYRFFHNPRKLKAIFTDSDIKHSLAIKLRPMYQRLEQLGLLQTSQEKKHTTLLLFLALALFGLTGTLRLVHGWSHDKPIGYLLFTFFLFVVACVTTFWPLSHRKTARGKQYHQRLQKHFSWLQSKTTPPSSQEVDPLLAVALFGAGAVLTDTLLADALKAQTIGMGSGSDGTGGCSSSGCGSSCGSGCGGGCGGCS